MATTTYTGLSYVRLLVARIEGPARLGAISWSPTDTSLYLFPPADYPRYRYGRTTAVGPGKGTFSTADMPETTELPKLTLHASGRAHIRTPSPPGSEPTQAGPLRHLRGKHMATIDAHRIADLPAYSLKKHKRGGASGEHNIVVRPPLESKMEGIRVLVYLNSFEPRFDCNPQPQLKAKITRPGYPVMHVGVALNLDEPPDGASGGVTLIGGWNPRVGRSRIQVIQALP